MGLGEEFEILTGFTPACTLSSVIPEKVLGLAGKLVDSWKGMLPLEAPICCRGKVVLDCAEIEGASVKEDIVTAALMMLVF